MEELLWRSCCGEAVGNSRGRPAVAELLLGSCCGELLWRSCCKGAAGEKLLLENCWGRAAVGKLQYFFVTFTGEIAQCNIFL